jgi:hypothetical protein
MRNVATKERILEDAGYAYSFDRSIYVNRAARKVFSVAFVQDHSEADLEELIKKPALPAGEWCFYFNADPSAAVKRDLSAILA